MQRFLEGLEAKIAIYSGIDDSQPQDNVASMFFGGSGAESVAGGEKGGMNAGR
jgi:hypothetical protein